MPLFGLGGPLASHRRTLVTQANLEAVAAFPFQLLDRSRLEFETLHHYHVLYHDRTKCLLSSPCDSLTQGEALRSASYTTPASAR